jgi:hypothetical protein
MRVFWLGSILSLALGFGLSALMYLSLTSPDSTNCEVNGVPCPEMATLDIILFCGLPAAVFSFIVLLGIRVRRHSPRAAAWLVSLPPSGLLIYAAIKAFTTPLVG